MLYKRKCLFCGLSHVQLFATPYPAAHQAPLSMGFSRQEYEQVGISYFRGLPNPGIKLMSITSPALAGRFFTTSITWEVYSVISHGLFFPLFRLVRQLEQQKEITLADGLVYCRYSS